MKILKFYSKTCGPCQMLEAMMHKEKIEHENIDVFSDDGSLLSKEYNVKGVPTVIILNDNNKEIKRYVGMIDINELKQYK